MAASILELTKPQARRIALSAQGFGDAPPARATMRSLTRTVERTGVLQVDSVNVLERAHYFPLYSRLGSYDKALLQRAQTGKPRRLIEYWAHVQALMPVELWPLMEHRRDHYRQRRATWWADVSPELVETVVAEIRQSAPGTARELERRLGGVEARAKTHWGWNWSQTRKALDLAYMTGDLVISDRNASFEPRYDLPERVLPAEVLNAATPTRVEAVKALTERAARSHGVASINCLADYYRMGVKETAVAVAELADEGVLERAAVEGWSRPVYVHRDSRRPRKVAARALLSPFDPVVWERARALALFDFHYRIEIYTPAAKRKHGYYVLPFLLGDQLVARVDLKADRAGGRLQVRGAFAEPNAPVITAEELASELRRVADWQGLDQISIHPRGDLAEALGQVLESDS